MVGPGAVNGLCRLVTKQFAVREVHRPAGTLLTMKRSLGYSYDCRDMLLDLYNG